MAGLMHGGGYRGSVLLLALLFVLLLSLIAASVVQTATLQLRMAGNDQFREEASQVAKAIAAELSQNPGNFLTSSLVGQSNCVPADPHPDCDERNLVVPDSAGEASGYELEYRVSRRAPLLWEDYPLRALQESAADGGPVNVALFEVDVRVDGRRNRRGAAHVVQGVAVQISESDAADSADEGAQEEMPEDVDNKLFRVYWREPGADPL